MGDCVMGRDQGRWWQADDIPQGRDGRRSQGLPRLDLSSHEATTASAIVEGVGVVGFDFARFIEGADRLFFSA